eukprot:3046344-Amphidinium_carterae.1
MFEKTYVFSSVLIWNKRSDKCPWFDGVFLECLLGVRAEQHKLHTRGIDPSDIFRYVCGQVDSLDG